MIEASNRDGRIRGWPALVAALALLVAACGSGDDATVGSQAEGAESTADATTDGTEGQDGEDAATGTTAEADAGAASSTTVAADDPATDETAGSFDEIDAPTVTVVDPGAEPRTELRIGLDGPLTGDLLITQTQWIEQEVDGQPLPATEPLTLVITTELEATPSPDGLIELRTEITGVEPGDDVDPAVAAQVGPAVRQMIGSTSVATLDERGRSLGTDLTWSAGGDEAVLGAIDQIAGSSQSAVPFPEEAVGIGAVWEATQHIPTSGVTIEATSRYRLEALVGDLATVSVESEQRVEPGSTMDIGGLSATVEAWDATSTGTATMDLRSVFHRFTLETTAVQQLTVGPQVIDQTIESAVTMTPG